MATLHQCAELSPTLSVTADTDEDVEVEAVIVLDGDEDSNGYGLSLLDNLLKDQEQYQKSREDPLSPLTPEAAIPKTPRNDEADDAAFDRILFSFSQQESTISDQRRSFMQKGALPNDVTMLVERCSSAGNLAMIEDHGNAEEDDDEKLITRTFSAGHIDDVADNVDLNPYIDANAYLFSDEENDEMDDDEDDDEMGGILRVEKKKAALDPVQQELIFERTTQSLMISCGDSIDVFESLRKICGDIQNDALLPYSVPFSHHVLTYNHTDAFLTLLGFEKNKFAKEWICDAPHRVEERLIKYAVLQCHKSLTLIHQHSSIKDIIFKHRERTGSASKSKKRKSTSTSKSKRKSLKPSANAKAVETLQEEDEKEAYDDSDEEEDGDEDADYLQLYELIWGVTSDNNADHEAEDVLLLCYPLVTTAKNIMDCLEARFFKNDDDELLPPTSPNVSHHSDSRLKFDRISSSFGVQESVIEFIQRWVENYWAKDWKYDENLIVRCEELMERIRGMYEGKESNRWIGKVLKLVARLNKTTSNQQRRQTIILNKLFGDTETGINLLGDAKPKRKLTATRSLWNMTTSLQSKYKMPNFKKDLQINNISHIIIAEQITLQTFMIYKSIHPRECLKQSWKDKERKDTVAHNITRYIDAFNRLTKWIQTCILGAPNVKQRGKTIKKWCKVEQELYKLRNFQALCAVYSALASCAIYKLKDAWHYVAKKHMSQHDMITVVMRSTGNWKNLRRLQLETHPPMIPYFGMFAQDLIAIEETTSDRSNDGSINWNALWRVNTVIDKYLMYQNTAYCNLSSNAIIQRWMNKELGKTDKVDGEWMFKISSHVNNKDKQEIQSKKR